MVSGNRELFRGANPALKVANVPLTIRVRWVHITDGQTGAVTKARRDKQMKVLNDAYKNTAFTFVSDEADVTSKVEPTWFKMTHGGDAERKAKKELHKDAKRFLNLYTAQPLGGVLGWARFPWQLAGDEELDGVVLDWRTLPDGSLTPYNIATPEPTRWATGWATTPSRTPARR
jgi:hypothetical protein